MPRTEEEKQRIREEQRATILEAARRVFAHKGLSATVDDVAAEAGVSHGLAYRYFANKEELFSALVIQTLKDPAIELQRMLAIPGTPSERLTILISGLVQSRQHPEPYQLLNQVLSSKNAPDELRELVQQRGRALQSLLRQLIVEGQEVREVAAGDPDQMVRALIACLDGLIHWAAHDSEQYQEHFPAAEIFLRMLKP